jgi:Phosphotransferase enzyme family
MRSSPMELPLPGDRALPTRLDDVTPEWLTGLLATRYPGAIVEGFEVVESLNSHTTKLRLLFDLNDIGIAAGLPRLVCVKANWSGMHTGLICEREARFYNLLRDDLAFPVPRAYFADWDSTGSGNGVVVMEDLACTPGRFGSSADRLGIDGVAAGLETLAVVHGALWNDQRLDAAWLPRSMGTDNDTEQVAQYWNYIEFNLGDPAYRAVVPGWVYERPGLMHHALDELSAFELGHPGPLGLVHGDAHQGNSFVRESGERVWLDWQLVRKGSPWRDVSYFVVNSLTVEERQVADRELVEHYRQCLVAAGASGVPDRDDAWDQFVRWPAYGAQAWLGNVNQWGQGDGAEMVKRQFAAADDYNTFGLLTRGRSPRRPFVPGEGAYRLPRALRDIRDRR